MLMRDESLVRKRYVVDDRSALHITIDNQQYINFSSNDYLSLSSHDAIKKAFIAGVEKFGVGSTSSALVSGYFHPHRALEEKFTEFVGRPKAILFNSGYQANLAVMQAFATRQTTVVSDKLCHASLLDGIQLSRAKHIRYKHNDIENLREILFKLNHVPMIVTESVFSMQGDMSPLQGIIALNQEKYLMVDDAHGVGVVGKRGAGIIEHLKLDSDKITCLISPLGKAFACYGALVSGAEDKMEWLLQTAKTYRYTTALPPALACAALAALTLVEREAWRREKLKTLINFFKLQARLRNIILYENSESPIQSIMIGDNTKALQIKKYLLSKNFFVACIRPPTVPKGTARLRISLTCAHSESLISQLLDEIAYYLKVTHDES